MQFNVDLSEIEKFRELASQWWDTQGPMQALHAINPLRFDYIQQHTSLTHQTVIDIGCGGGILTESMAKTGAIVTGIDMNEAAIKVAKLHQKESQLTIDYQVITAEAMASAHPASFDVVTCLEMLEHVPDPISIVQAAAKLVKPNGHVFFSTFNRNVKSYLFGIIGAEYLLKLLPKHTHDFAKFIKPSELAEWARRENLVVEDMAGLNYHLLTKKYTLNRDVSVNYIMCLKHPIN